MNSYLHYFAYGSNMSLKRLRARVPDAQPIGRAALPGHELRFHKRGRDGSAKCDAFYIGPGNRTLAGVLFTLPSSGLTTLDRIEGLGAGYERKQVDVELDRGDMCRALTYYATDIDAALTPFCWYRHHVLTGANEFGLPRAHIEAIEAVNTLRDPDSERRAREYSHYDPYSAPGTTGNGR